MPDARPYPSDVSDAEWAVLPPLLPPPAPCGRPRKWPERLVADAVFYVLRSGCAWRMLRREFPPALAGGRAPAATAGYALRGATGWRRSARPRSASSLAGGWSPAAYAAHLRLARALAPAEQGLRAAAGRLRGDDLRRDEPADAPPAHALGRVTAFRTELYWASRGSSGRRSPREPPRTGCAAVGARRASAAACRAAQSSA